MAQTRRRSAHFILGQPTDLPKVMLPLKVDIFNHFKKVKEEDTSAPNSSVAYKVANEVIILWRDRGNLPTLDIRTVQRRVESVYMRGKDFLKIPKIRRDKMLTDLDEQENDVEKSKSVGRKKKQLYTLEKLFDICPCQHLSREVRDCLLNQKVSAREFPFLCDQRTCRKMVFCGTDQKITDQWENRRKIYEMI